MTYKPEYNEQNYKYRSAKFKRVGIDFDKEYYNNVLKPAADACGLPVGTYIKRVIAEEIERDKISVKEKKRK